MMKKTILMTVGAILIAGCTNHTPASETIADNAKESISDMYNALTPECKTEDIKNHKEKALKEIDAVKSACNAEKKAITSEKNKYEALFYALVIAIIALFINKER